MTLNSNGSFTYTPTANYNGSDSFTYKANDGKVDSNTATVNITINAVNDPPIAVNDAYTTNEDIALNRTTPGVLSNDTDADGDSLTAVKVSEPSHGSVTLNGNGSFTYTPNANYNGTDSFTYRANDGQANSNTATVTITITAVNDPPVAVNDFYNVVSGGVLTIASPGVLTNDRIANGDPLKAVLVSDVSHCSLILNDDGSFVYTSTTGYTGTDSFTYRASNGLADSNVATVTIINAASGSSSTGISNILSSSITETSADISWTTDELSTSQVEYWGRSRKLSLLNWRMVTNHLVKLTGLTPSTTYSYRVRSVDKAGNKTVSEVGTFTTLQRIYSVSELSITPAVVNLGQQVTISVLVTNSGGAAGSYKVILKINGVAENTQEVTLDAGQNQKITFTTKKNTSGLYLVNVNGITGSFQVTRTSYHRR